MNVDRPERSAVGSRPKYKSCFVSNCENNSIKNPELYFFPVPYMEKRKKWGEAVGRVRLHPKSTIHCCSEHFNLKSALNPFTYKSTLTLRSHVLPSNEQRFDNGDLSQYVNVNARVHKAIECGNVEGESNIGPGNDSNNDDEKLSQLKKANSSSANAASSSIQANAFPPAQPMLRVKDFAHLRHMQNSSRHFREDAATPTITIPNDDTNYDDSLGGHQQ